MEAMYREHIENKFQELDKAVHVQIAKLYSEIASDLSGSEAKGFGGEITQLEAKKWERLTMQLMDQSKNAAVEEMGFCGCKPYLFEAGWTEIQQKVGVPKIELCKIKVNIHPGSNAAKNSDQDEKEFKKIISQFEAKKKHCMMLTASGAIVTAITWIIPGWNMPVIALGTAGATVAAVGVGGTIYNCLEEDKAKSKFEQFRNKTDSASSEENLDGLLSKIVKSQRELNQKNYSLWLEKVKASLIEECDKLSQM